MSSTLFQERLTSLKQFNSWAEFKETALSRNLFAVDFKSNLLFCNPKNELFLIDLRTLKTAKNDEEIEKCVKDIHLKDNARIDFDVIGMKFSGLGEYVCIYGIRRIVVIELPEIPKVSTIIPCRSWRMFESEFKLSLRLRVTLVKWHPLSSHHLTVLLSDNTLRIFNISNPNREVPEQSFRLTSQKLNRRFRVYDSDEESDEDNDNDNNEGKSSLIDHSTSVLTSHGRKGKDPVVSFCFGGDRGWERFSVIYITASGKVYILCPVIPYNCFIPREYVSNLIPDKKSRSRSYSQSPSLRFGIQDEEDEDFDEEEEEEEENNEDEEDYYFNNNNNNNDNNLNNNINNNEEMYDEDSLDGWILRYLEQAVNWRSVVYHDNIPFVKTNDRCTANPFRPHNVCPIGPLPFTRSTPLPLAEHAQRCDIRLIFNGISTIVLLDPRGGWVTAYVLLDPVAPAWRSAASATVLSDASTFPELIEFEDIDLELNPNPDTLPFFVSATDNGGPQQENLYVVHDGGVCLVNLPFVSHLPDLFRSEQFTENDIPETPSPAAVIRTKSNHQLGAYIKGSMTIPIAVECIADNIVGVYLITLCIQSTSKQQQQQQQQKQQQQKQLHLDIVNMDKASMLASFTPIVTTEPPTLSHSTSITPFDTVLQQDQSINVERVPRLISDSNRNTYNSSPSLSSSSSSPSLSLSTTNDSRFIKQDNNNNNNNSTSLNLFLKTLKQFKHDHVVKIRQLQVHISDRLEYLREFKEKQEEEVQDLQKLIQKITLLETDLTSKHRCVSERQEKLSQRASKLLRRVSSELSPLSKAERQYHSELYKTKSRIKNMNVRIEEIQEEEEEEEEEMKMKMNEKDEREGTPTREQIRDIEGKLRETFEKLQECCTLVDHVRDGLN